MQNNQIIIYETESGETTIDVRLRNETIWLTQAQITIFFRRDRTVITKHINNIFKEKELEKKPNVQKMRIANSDKPVTLYSLDVIISVGYRVKSNEGTKFRIWANKILRNQLLHGIQLM